MKFFIQGDNGVMLECNPILIEDRDTLRVTISTDWDLDQACQAYEQICKLYPNNKIVGLFSGMTLVKEEEPKEPVQLEYEGIDEYWGPWGKCPVCGHSNRDFDGYCSYCGTKVKGSGGKNE